MARRGFWGVAFILWMSMVGANVPSPLYAVYASRWHFGTATVTMIFAVYVAFLIPTLLIGGQWSDHRGRKPVIWLGWSLAIVGAAAFLGAHSMLWLVGARAAQGAGAGFLSGAATAHLTELDGSRGRAALVASLATGGGTAVGPLLGGILAQYGPWPLRLAFVVVLVGLIGGGILLLRATETRPDPTRRFHWTSPRIPQDIRRVFWLAGGTAFTVWSVTAFFMSLAPSYVMTLLHVHNLAIAGGVVFLMLATASATQWMTRRAGPRQSMPIGLGLIVVAVIGLLWAGSLQSLWMVIASTILAGIGQGSAFLGSMAMVTRLVPAALKAQVMSSFYVVVYCGVGAPVLGIGWVAQQVGLYRAMLYYTIFIAMVALSVIVGLWMGRHVVRMALETPVAATKKI